ncbi:hypothetical protein VYU27_007297 [Nannochloropsis oceanica]
MVGIHKTLLVAAVTMASVSAFVPPAPAAPRTRGVMKMGLDGMIGSSAPFKNFDPLGFAAKADQKTLNKYRESELKHGRVAMLAVLGWIVQEFWHPLYDGKLSSNPLKCMAFPPSLPTHPMRRIPHQGNPPPSPCPPSLPPSPSWKICLGPCLLLHN